MVSDGSFADLFASAAFIVEGPTKKGQVTGSIIATGRPTVMSAYRGGLAGLYMTIVVVNTICKIHDIQQGRITIGCNGKLAL